MKWKFTGIGVLGVVLATGMLAPVFAAKESEEKAMAAMDAFMAAFNARDPETWAKTLNYPHVRIAGGNVRVWETAEDYAAGMDFDRIVATGWDHSEWASRKIVQSSQNKAHIAVEFRRYKANGEVIGKFPSFYIVTNNDGHWGVQARSSFLEEVQRQRAE